MTINGLATFNNGISVPNGVDKKFYSGAQILTDAAHIMLSNLSLPTQSSHHNSTHHAYTDLGHGNILFKHTESEHTYLDGPYTSLFLVTHSVSLVTQTITVQCYTYYGLWLRKIFRLTEPYFVLVIHLKDMEAAPLILSCCKAQKTHRVYI